MIFYTYLWLRWDGTPYYVGKGTGQRAYRRGCPPHEQILVQDWTSEEEAFEAEKFLIARWGRKDNGTGILINRTDGGEGGICNTGKPRSLEHCRKISEALRGKHPTPETLEKLRKSHLGYKRPDSDRRKISESLRGNKRSLGYKHTLETRQKMSKSRQGKKLGPRKPKI